MKESKKESHSIRSIDGVKAASKEDDTKRTSTTSNKNMKVSEDMIHGARPTVPYSAGISSAEKAVDAAISAVSLTESSSHDLASVCHEKRKGRTSSGYFDPSSFLDRSEHEDEDQYMKQTERRRIKEKQRRLNISSSIETLGQVLLQIDPTNLIQHNHQLYAVGGGIKKVVGAAVSNKNNAPSSKRRRHGHCLESSIQNQALTRAEIIDYATNILQNLVLENKRLCLKLVQQDHDLLRLSNYQQRISAIIALTSSGDRDIGFANMADHALIQDTTIGGIPLPSSQLRQQPEAFYQAKLSSENSNGNDNYPAMNLSHLALSSQKLLPPAYHRHCKDKTVLSPRSSESITNTSQGVGITATASTIGSIITTSEVNENQLKRSHNQNQRYHSGYLLSPLVTGPYRSQVTEREGGFSTAFFDLSSSSSLSPSASMPSPPTEIGPRNFIPSSYQQKIDIDSSERLKRKGI